MKNMYVGIPLKNILIILRLVGEAGLRYIHYHSNLTRVVIDGELFRNEEMAKITNLLLYYINITLLFMLNKCLLYINYMFTIQHTQTHAHT